MLSGAARRFRRRRGKPRLMRVCGLVFTFTVGVTGRAGLRSSLLRVAPRSERRCDARICGRSVRAVSNPKTTNSDHASRISPNLLKNAGDEPSGAGEAIIGDITYIRLRDGSFCYPAVFQDKFTPRIVGSAISMRMTVQLVIDAFEMARRRTHLKGGAITHTDRGSQYAAVEFRRLLYIYGLRQSMSAKGNCYENAQAESFFSRFKAELIEGGIFESIDEAKSEIFSYIEGYYNRIRRHSALGYKSPLEFEKKLRIENQRRRDSFLG